MSEANGNSTVGLEYFEAILNAPKPTDGQVNDLWDGVLELYKHKDAAKVKENAGE